MRNDPGYPDDIRSFDHDPRSPFFVDDMDEDDQPYGGTPADMAAYHKNNPQLALRICTKAVRHFLRDAPSKIHFPQDHDFWEQVVRAWWQARRDAQSALQAWSCRRADLIRTLEGLGWNAEWTLCSERELKRWVEEARQGRLSP